jgi:PilZ domain
MIPQNPPSVLPPMKGSERRLSPRNSVERFAYINIEPSNGGSVLNVSEGGLCFHSIAPIQRTKTIRFWFREHHQRIEVQGELVWMDELQKTGGLRFTDLPEEAREAMRKWVCLPEMPVASDQVFPLSSLLRQSNHAPRTNRRDAKVAPDNSEPPAMVSRDARVQAPLAGFSGGLVTGLLVSALLVTPFLFRSYKRQLGESLIYWGERFAARPRPVMQTVAPVPQAGPPVAQAVVLAPQAESPSPQKTVAAARMVRPAATSIPVLRPERALPEYVKGAAKPQTAHLPHETPTPATPSPTTPAPTTPSPATSTATAALAPRSSVAVPAVATSKTLSTTSLPAAPLASGPNVVSAKSIPDKSEPASALELANRSRVQTAAQNAGASAQLYYEVGKFKDPLLAYRASNNLAHLGFRATVVEKGHFWTNSHHLLVGPYDDDSAEGIRRKLISSGFKPQVFERGSRNLTVYGGCDTMSRLLRSERTSKNIQMPAEDCVISWETYNTHAMVAFVQENNTIATADGKWVKHGTKYQRDAFVYRKNDDGSQTLIEIQFSGLSHALVFNKS